MAEIALRKMFIPDPGYVIIDADLKGADARVVAWEADDASLKELFHKGLKLHLENAKAIYGACDGPDDKRYQTAKNGVHAVNYGVRERTLAATLGTTIAEASGFIEKWLTAHPGIRRWHDRVEGDLRSKKRVKNAYGFARPYFDRIETVLPQALAWIGQSTVAITINKAMLQIEERLPFVQFLLQVHDSLVMQVPRSEYPSIVPAIREAMEVVIPYSDPLIIPASIKASDRSWGDCEEI